ncbi:probable anion transporter 4, chloroplastic isoform X2 [Elaeis guineensis]|uniref:Ascorbate transporter, chloroplastic isoform X3 n=1 Tax=Elaeis guineensis var. tenera TaxID=51953 RepID=A0A6I9S143_ELAGV|nr:ascorbate transporter, chloroplastic isoform X3 [Elaeis guineensis]
MAMGAVISGRNFGSPLISGKYYQAEWTAARDRKVHATFPGEHFALGANFSFSAQRGSSSVVRCAFFTTYFNSGLDKITMAKRIAFLGGMEHPLSISLGNFSAGRLGIINLKRRTPTRTECFLSSDLLNNGWLQPRKLDNVGISDSPCDNSEYRSAIRPHADFRSEQYEMTGPQMDSLNSSEVPSEAVLFGGDVRKVSHWWEQFPKRWLIVLLCFFSFLLCNMDRVNMSIAILPMSTEFKWNPATMGLIQSSFFWGYLLTQIVGGIWADKIGGKLVLGFGVVWWSIATVLTPIAAKIGLPFLLVMRAFMGIGEGVAMPAMNNILSKWIPVSERSRSLAFVYSGMYLGSVTGLALSPILIHNFGWPSVFYAFGSLGSIWFALWQSKVLKFNLTESGLFCVLPWLTMAVFANVGGWIADTLVGKGLSITTVRKIMQSIGFLGPAFFLTQLSHVRTPALAVLCMACSQGSDAFSQSGLYSNHQDIGPRYAGVLLGLSNTAGVLAGVFGTAATGYILQRGSWDDVFKVSVALYIIGTLVWNIFATGEKVLD